MDFLIIPLSKIHQWICRIKYRLYTAGLLKPRRSSLPVLSVGNIAFGGSEKTPLVMALISALQDRGRKVAVLSRGYRGGWEKSGGILSEGDLLKGDWRDSGDEPFMIARNFPSAGVFIGRDRFSSCQQAAQRGFDLAILDDGFQHLRLFRDVDIVLYDPHRNTSLRESPSNLKRAHIVLVKGSAQDPSVEKAQKRFSPARIFPYQTQVRGLAKLDDGSHFEPAGLASKRILAFCGIAQPERFRSSLAEAGINPESFLTFPDHHDYPTSSISRIKGTARACGAEVLLTTEKDSVKIPPTFDRGRLPVYSLKIGLSITPDFYDHVFSLLSPNEQKTGGAP